MIEQITPNFYAVKDKKGNYKQVWPWKKDITKPLGKGNINWKNVFKVNWLTILIILFIVFSIWAYFNGMKQYNELYIQINSPCMNNCYLMCNNSINFLNLSKIGENGERQIFKTDIASEDI